MPPLQQTAETERLVCDLIHWLINEAEGTLEVFKSRAAAHLKTDPEIVEPQPISPWRAQLAQALDSQTPNPLDDELTESILTAVQAFSKNENALPRPLKDALRWLYHARMLSALRNAWEPAFTQLQNAEAHNIPRRLEILDSFDCIFWKSVSIAWNRFTILGMQNWMTRLGLSNPTLDLIHRVAALSTMAHASLNQGAAPNALPVRSDQVSMRFARKLLNASEHDALSAESLEVYKSQLRSSLPFAPATAARFQVFLEENNYCTTSEFQKKSQLTDKGVIATQNLLNALTTEDGPLSEESLALLQHCFGASALSRQCHRYGIENDITKFPNGMAIMRVLLAGLRSSATDVEYSLMSDIGLNYLKTLSIKLTPDDNASPFISAFSGFERYLFASMIEPTLRQSAGFIDDLILGVTYLSHWCNRWLVATPLDFLYQSFLSRFFQPKPETSQALALEMATLLQHDLKVIRREHRVTQDASQLSRSLSDHILQVIFDGHRMMTQENLYQKIMDEFPLLKSVSTEFKPLFEALFNQCQACQPNETPDTGPITEWIEQLQHSFSDIVLAEILGHNVAYWPFASRPGHLIQLPDERGQLREYHSHVAIPDTKGFGMTVLLPKELPQSETVVTAHVVFPGTHDWLSMLRNFRTDGPLSDVFSPERFEPFADKAWQDKTIVTQALLAIDKTIQLAERAFPGRKVALSFTGHSQGASASIQMLQALMEIIAQRHAESEGDAIQTDVQATLAKIKANTEQQADISHEKQLEIDALEEALPQALGKSEVTCSSGERKSRVWQTAALPHINHERIASLKVNTKNSPGQAPHTLFGLSMLSAYMVRLGINVYNNTLLTAFDVVQGTYSGTGLVLTGDPDYQELFHSETAEHSAQVVSRAVEVTLEGASYRQRHTETHFNESCRHPLSVEGVFADSSRPHHGKKLRELLIRPSMLWPFLRDIHLKKVWPKLTLLHKVPHLIESFGYFLVVTICLLAQRMAELLGKIIEWLNLNHTRDSELNRSGPESPLSRSLNQSPSPTSGRRMEAQPTKFALHAFEREDARNRSIRKHLEVEANMFAQLLSGSPTAQSPLSTQTKTASSASSAAGQ